MKKMSLFLSLLLLVMISSATLVLADERKVVTSIILQQEYSDNVFWSSQSEEDDFISTLSPVLELINNTERLQSNIKMQLDGVYYYENDELNTLDQDYAGSLRYQMSQRLKLSTSAGYARDSRIDSDFAETGLLLGNNVSRDRYMFRAGGDYALSEIMGMQLQYGFNSDVYESSQFSDYNAHNVSLQLNRDLSRLISRTVARVNLGVGKFDLETSEVTVYSATVGAERSLDERFSFFADVGLNYTESTFESFRLVPSGIPGIFLVEPFDEDVDDLGFTGKAGVTYKGELTNAVISFSHGVTAASGRDGTVERTSLQGNIGHRLNETSRIVFSAGYTINKGSEDELSATEIDETSLRLKPSLIYSLTDNIAAEASYNYSWVQDNEADTDTERNLIMLRIIFDYTIFE